MSDVLFLFICFFFLYFLLLFLKIRYLCIVMMKNSFLMMCRIKLLFCLSLLGILLSTSCTRVIDEEGFVAEEGHSVKIMTRSDMALAYPLTLYAFDSNTGEMRGKVCAVDDADELLLHLPQGKYHLLALGGVDECNVPDSPTWEDVIALPATNCLPSPLQMGMGDVLVARNTTVNITLYHQVAAVDLCLTDIPVGVKTVSVSLSLLYNRLKFNGETSGSAVANVDLKKQPDGTWTAPTFYVLPTVSNKLVLSITTVTDGGQETYGYTYNGGLKANTPYVLSGSFKQGFKVDGLLELAGWHEPQTVVFTFGGGDEGEGEVENDKVESGDEEIGTDEMPVAGTLWQGHFVAAVENVSDTEVELLLLSLAEWRGVPSAYNAENPDLALEVVAEYEEDGLTGWSIPTKDEAKLMRGFIGNDSLLETNRFLASQDIVGLSDNMEDEDGNKVRYLCENAKMAFVWDVQTSNTISKCGTKRTYYMRAIKRVKVALK